MTTDGQTLQGTGIAGLQDLCNYYDIDMTYPSLPNYFRNLTEEETEAASQLQGWKDWETLDLQRTEAINSQLDQVFGLN